MKTKMIEAKCHEEKLKLQQKHDADVQKVGYITIYCLINIDYLKYSRSCDRLSTYPSNHPPTHPPTYVRTCDNLCCRCNSLN